MIGDFFIFIFSGIVNDKAESDCIYTMTSNVTFIIIIINDSLFFYLPYFFFSFRTYHDYAKSMGTKYTKPDLAIAFNSGCSQAVSSWKETIVFLKQNNIPSIFTVSFTTFVSFFFFFFFCLLTAIKTFLFFLKKIST